MVIRANGTTVRARTTLVVNRVDDATAAPRAAPVGPKPRAPRRDGQRRQDRSDARVPQQPATAHTDEAEESRRSVSPGSDMYVQQERG